MEIELIEWRPAGAEQSYRGVGWVSMDGETLVLHQYVNHKGQLQGIPIKIPSGQIIDRRILVCL